MPERSPLPEEQGPTIQPKTHWCSRHLEPFRERWPEGWMLASLALFNVMVRDDRIIAAAGGDARLLDRVILEHSPMCCFVGDTQAERWTALALGPLPAYQAALQELTSA